MSVCKDKVRGTYYYSFKRVVDGKIISKTKRGFSTKQEATYAELKALDELNKNNSYDNLKFKDLFDLFKEYQSSKVKSSTISIYNRIYRSHIEPYFADFYCFSINDKDLFKWKKTIINKGFNQRFTNSIIGLMRKLIELGVKKQVFKKPDSLLDELDSVKIQRIENNERAVWSFDEIKKFLDSFDKDTEYTYWLYFYTFSNTGMRPNEFRALQVKDIQGDYLVVNKTINSKDGNKDILLPPKNPNSNRKVLMPHEIIEVLTEYTKDYKPDHFIFGKEKALRETTLNRYLEKHIKLADLHPIVLYGFRHSHATNLIKANVPIKVVSKRLGHANASTTMNVYWHLFKDDENQVLDILKTK